MSRQFPFNPQRRPEDRGVRILPERFSEQSEAEKQRCLERARVKRERRALRAKPAA